MNRQCSAIVMLSNMVENKKVSVHCIPYRPIHTEACVVSVCMCLAHSSSKEYILCRRLVQCTGQRKKA